MTYRDEIVDEVRAIREQLCNQAGNLDNLLVTLRAEEATHVGRMAKHLKAPKKAQNSGLYGADVFGGTQKSALPLTLGTLRVILSSSAVDGVTQVGNVATITLQLANSAVPTTSNFSVSAVSVTDAVLYNQISGMGAVVADVTLQ